MRSNSFGQTLTLTTFGESHGPAIGAVLDGVPAGLALENEHIASALHRRRPGQSVISSPRQEKDDPEILSGVFEGKTLGTPIAVIVRNKDARPADYNTELRRVGHADAMWEKKYGFRDYRGGGRASGRETVARVIGGAIAERLLPRETHIVACVTQIGDIAARVLPQELTRQHVDAFTTRCPDAEADERMM
jgi:chorismate synthase